MTFNDWLKNCFSIFKKAGIFEPDLTDPGEWLASSNSDLSSEVREKRIKSLFQEERRAEAERELLVGHGLLAAAPEFVNKSKLFYASLIQRLGDTSRDHFRPQAVQETWHRPGWCNHPIVELTFRLEDTVCTVLLPRRNDFAVPDVIPALNALIPRSDVAIHLLVEGQDWYLIVLSEEEHEAVCGEDFWMYHTKDKTGTRIVNGDTPQRDAVLLPAVTEPSTPDRDTGFLYFFRGFLRHEAGETDAAWEDWQRADRLGMESALQTARTVVDRPAMSVRSYLRAGEAFVPVEKADPGDIDDPRHVEGAIELTIGETPVLTREEWDDVDQLWDYIVDGLIEARAGNIWKTKFPDQPLELTFKPMGKDIQVQLAVRGKIRSETAQANHFLRTMKRAGNRFFEQLKRLSAGSGTTASSNLEKLASLEENS